MMLQEARPATPQHPESGEGAADDIISAYLWEQADLQQHL